MNRRLCNLSLIATLLSASAFANLADRLLEFAGEEFTRVKVVWVRGQTENQVQGISTGFNTTQQLMGFDTETGVLDTLEDSLTNYRRPLITHDGSRVVWTNLEGTPEVWIADWKGRNRTLLAKGTHGALWFDESAEQEYLIYAKECGTVGRCAVYRMNMESGEEEVFFNGPETFPLQRELTPYWMSVSADGKILAAQWPYPQDIVAYNIETEEAVLTVPGRCWPVMPYSSVYYLGVFNQDHTELSIHRTGSGQVQNIWLGPSNFIKFSSYNPLVLCGATTSEAEGNGTGNVTLYKFDDTLGTLLDTVILSTGARDGYSDAWFGTMQVREPELTLLAPTPGETLWVADTVNFRYECNETCLEEYTGGVEIYVTNNQGVDWHRLCPIEQSGDACRVLMNAPHSGDVNIVMPDTLMFRDLSGDTNYVSLVSDAVHIKLKVYGTTFSTVSEDPPFVVAYHPSGVRSSIGQSISKKPNIRLLNGAIRIDPTTDGTWEQVTVINSLGQKVYTGRAESHLIPLPAGVYYLRKRSAGETAAVTYRLSVFHASGW